MEIDHKVEVHKPKIVLIDISGTIAMKAFMSYSNESKDFLKKHIKEFVGECYPKMKELRLAFNFMKHQERQEKNKKDVTPKLADNNAPRDKKVDSIIKWVLHKVETDPNAYTIPAVSLFQLHMIYWGYEKGLLKTPIYDDVFEVLTHWTQIDKLALYFTLASNKFTELVLSHTTAGDLRPFFKSNVFLMEFKEGKLTKSFNSVLQTLKVEAKNVLFLTRIAEDAREAKQVGFQCVLVIRKDFEPHFSKKISEAKKIREQTLDKQTDSNSSQTSISISRNSSSMSIAQSLFTTSSSLGEISSTEDASSVEGLTTASTIEAPDLAEFPAVCKLKDIIFK